MDPSTVGAWLGVILAGTAVLAIIYKVFKGAVVLERSLPVLLSISEEFSPNSGLSLKDQVNRIETGISSNTTRIITLEAHAIHSQDRSHDILNAIAKLYAQNHLVANLDQVYHKLGIDPPATRSPEERTKVSFPQEEDDT